MMALLIKASVIMIAAASGQRLLGPRASAATRHLWWTATVAALLVLPALTLSLPHWYLDVPGPDRTEKALPAPVHAEPLLAADPPIDSPSQPLVAAGRAAKRSGRATSIGWSSIAGGLYAAGVLLLLLRVMVERSRVRGVVRRATAMTAPGWSAVLDGCRQRIGTARPARLLRSEETTMPMAVEADGAAILLPAAADAWPDDRREAVLLHELAHVARRDCQTQALAALACALYWLHPGTWWIARRLRVERELACDDRVLAGGADARDYAEHLLEIAYTMNRQTAPALAVTMAGAGQLEGRMLAVLDAARNRTTPALRTCAATAVVAAIVLLPMATIEARMVPGPIVTAAAIAPAPVSAAAAAPAQPAPVTPEPGTWTLHLQDGNRVQLTLGNSNSSHSVYVAAASLDGLRPDHLSGTGGSAQFSLRREAGTFTFDGVVRAGAGGGTVTFAPDKAFAATLIQRGFARPTDRDLFMLALRDIGRPFLDEVRAQGYATPDLATLVRSAEHGVDLTYLRDMARSGYKLGTLESLVRLRDHGVDAAFIRALDEQGLRGLAPEDIVRARDHGVDSQYVVDMRALGFRNLSLDELVRTRDHGITPQYVRDMAALGYRGLSPEEAVSARDHGVEPNYVRELQALGYRGLSLRDLVTTRDHGVDVAYIRELSSLGYDSLSRDELIRLRDHGVTADRIRSANSRAGNRLSLDALRRLADNGWR